MDVHDDFSVDFEGVRERTLSEDYNQQGKGKHSLKRGGIKHYIRSITRLSADDLKSKEGRQGGLNVDVGTSSYLPPPPLFSRLQISVLAISAPTCCLHVMCLPHFMLRMETMNWMEKGVG